MRFNEKVKIGNTANTKYVKLPLLKSFLCNFEGTFLNLFRLFPYNLIT